MTVYIEKKIVNNLVDNCDDQLIIKIYCKIINEISNCDNILFTHGFITILIIDLFL